jgi:hypothetical protein
MAQVLVRVVVKTGVKEHLNAAFPFSTNASLLELYKACASRPPLDQYDLVDTHAIHNE